MWNEAFWRSAEVQRCGQRLVVSLRIRRCLLFISISGFGYFQYGSQGLWSSMKVFFLLFKSDYRL